MTAPEYSYVKDLAERVALTFAEAFLGVFVVTDLSTAENAAVAGAAAVVAVVKGLVAQAVGKYRSASLVD